MDAGCSRPTPPRETAAADEDEDDKMHPIQPGVQAQAQDPAVRQDRLYLYRPFVTAALVNGHFKNIVAIPKHIDINEWVAINSAPFTRNRYL